ncbi:MAG: ABC transporter permease [Dehalococcoidia bacterium]|nr:ABC transporter permease [Dehalococcoidia bacterium]
MTNHLLSFRFIRVWQRNRDVFLRLWKTEFASALAEPIVVLLAMGLGLGGLVGLISGQNYLQFIAPGILASYVMFSATFECTYGTFIRMEHQRTFDAIIATPVNIEDVITGEISWAATRSLITAASILIILFFFGLIDSLWVLWLLPLSFLSGFMFGSMAMFFTSLAPSINSFNYYFTLFITPMFFFSGVFFPLDSTPAFVQVAANFIPLTPSVLISRSVMQENLQASNFIQLAYMVFIAVAFFSASLVTMKKRLIK